MIEVDLIDDRAVFSELAKFWQLLRLLAFFTLFLCLFLLLFLLLGILFGSFLLFEVLKRHCFVSVLALDKSLSLLYSHDYSVKVLAITD